jgi:nitroreductase
MAALDDLISRHSTPSRQLGPPGPDPAQLLQMLTAAVHVPDHGKLVPWRFLRITGGARMRLGDALAQRALQRDPTLAAASMEKERRRFSFAPVIVAVIARITPNHKIPEIEQLLSGGCACFSLLQAAHALGFGAQWLTGWAAYDPQITALLGLNEHERVLGFIHIGSAIESASDRDRPDPRDLLSDWNPTPSHEP